MLEESEKMANNDPYILLVHPLYGNETNNRIFHPGIEIPISLAYLSSYLEQHGIPNDILDLRIERDPEKALRKYIKTRKPLAVGLTASTANIQNAAETAGQIKNINSDISTIIGGWHASALPEETLKNYRQFDYLVHGEGEIALLNLANCLSHGQKPDDIKSVAFRVNGSLQVNPREKLISNLDEIPFPAIHKVSIDQYRPAAATRNYLKLPSTGISVGRGCPYACLFCYKGVWGNGVRFRSPENVIEEIEVYIKKYGIKDFRFYDDTITFPKWDLKHFCEEIIRRKLNISWNCWSRVNDVDEEKLRLMKMAGCYHIKFGIEFGTEKALKLARKAATLDQARTALALCKKVGIECKGSFIFGIPGETEADCIETLKFALKVSPHFATFYPFDPIPGSPFYRKIASGQIDPKHDMIDRSVAEKIANQAYRSFYFRFRFVLQRLKSLLLHPKREAVMLGSGMKMLACYGLRKLRRAKSVSGNVKKDKTKSDVRSCLEKVAHRKIFEKVALRVVELILSLAALIVTFPLMVIIGIIIKIDSPGPCIFRQKRIGKNRRTDVQSADADSKEFPLCLRKKDLGGRPFTFYKFRTMYKDARERYPELYEYKYGPEEIDKMFFKISDDPRLTRFGKHLRKTTLDELPNCINVLKGDVTLVGPRPDIPEMIQYYKPQQRKKTMVKPGITGLSQINGRGLLNFQETLKCDVEYVENQSFGMDLKIIFKTFYVMIKRIGAF